MENLASTKKIIYTTLGIFILAVLLFFVYRYLVPARPGAPTGSERVTGRLPGLTGAGELGAEPGPEGLKPGESLETAPEQKLFRITDFPVISPSLNKEENKIFYYKKEGGDLFSSDLDGKNQIKISNITVVGLIEAIWSETKDRAAVFYLDQETLKGFLHIGTSSVATLPQDIKSISFAPGGKSLAYLLPKDGRTNLVLADSSGKNPKVVFSAPLRDAAIFWISPDKIAFLTAPSGLGEGYIFLFSRSSGSFSKILGPLFGLTSLWSPDGSRVLTATTNTAGKNLDMAVRDASGKELFLLNTKTLPQKCAWQDAKKLYCAVPRAIAPATVWPDDYLRGELGTSDRIIYLDLEKKEVNEIFSGGGFAVADLAIAKNGQYLIFTNRTDGTLWSLKLK